MELEILALELSALLGYECRLQATPAVGLKSTGLISSKVIVILVIDGRALWLSTSSKPLSAHVTTHIS